MACCSFRDDATVGSDESFPLVGSDERDDGGTVGQFNRAGASLRARFRHMDTPTIFLSLSKAVSSDEGRIVGDERGETRPLRSARSTDESLASPLRSRRRLEQAGAERQGPVDQGAHARAQAASRGRAAHPHLEARREETTRERGRERVCRRRLLRCFFCVRASDVRLVSRSYQAKRAYAREGEDVFDEKSKGEAPPSLTLVRARRHRSVERRYEK